MHAGRFAAGNLEMLNVVLLVDLVRCMQCRLGGAKTGVEEEVSPGDVMVIPAGVAHERYAASAALETLHCQTVLVSSRLLVWHINCCRLHKYLVISIFVCFDFAELNAHMH